MARPNLPNHSRHAGEESEESANPDKRNIRVRLPGRDFAATGRISDRSENYAPESANLILRPTRFSLGFDQLDQMVQHRTGKRDSMLTFGSEGQC